MPLGVTYAYRNVRIPVGRFFFLTSEEVHEVSRHVAMVPNDAAISWSATWARGAGGTLDIPSLQPMTVWNQAPQ